VVSHALLDKKDGITKRSGVSTSKIAAFRGFLVFKAPGKRRAVASQKKPPAKEVVGETGLEPVTSCV
jgi:hypothetical protein